ncbi:uncharacterized protein LOC143033824 [Oratosquilla oratoria]|uniref:uncharacterized protein LOC143033824 n=1 Tax=Oratosquilla oratoria TaxID=337810 RepID=UPI003F7703A1
MLNKDVQDIIEGVHYFLSESLSCEQLTGKAECLRNALVLQLEALAVNYPTLKLHKGPSYQYLNMDQGGTGGGGGSGTSSAGGSGSGTVQAKRPLLTNEGSGSSVCSNSSNSGDPFTFPSKPASSTKTGGRIKSTVDDDKEDEYEELDQDFLRNHVNKYTKETFFEPSETPHVVVVPPAESTSEPSCPTTSHSSNVDPTPEAVADMDDPEENYMTTVPSVAFSTLIAKGEKNGELLKKSKGLLRNIKKYHGVVANRLLYLYLKETDEVQKKVIDLTQYTARVATGDDFKDQRKKDAAFELVGVGKKTHTFVARTAKDKNQWLAAIQRVSSVNLNDTQEFPMESRQDLDEPSSLMLPPKPPPPMSVKDPHERGSVPLGNKEVPEEEADEFYEELDANPSNSNPSSVFASSTSTSKPSVPTKDDDTDEVYEEAEPLPTVPSVFNTPGLIPKKSPPDRPPLPLRLQHVLQQRLRPLPNTPCSSVPSGEANEEDGDEIYCEIDEEVDGEQLTMTHTPGSTTTQHSLRTPPTNPSHSEISSVPNDTLSDELYEEPDINLDPPPSQFRMTNTTVVSTPPKLPPRGIPTQPLPTDDTEYKVPQSFNLDTEYQVPQSNPVQASSNSQVRKGNIPTYQVPPSNAAVPSTTQLMSEGTCNDSDEKKTSNSFRAQTNVSQNIKSFEKKDQVCQKEVGSQDKDKNKRNIHAKFNTGIAKDPEFGQGFSVKDIISRMNKNNTIEGGTSGNTILNKVQTSVTKDSQQKTNSVTNTQRDKDRPNLINEDSLVKPMLPEPQKNGVDKNEIDNGVMEEVKVTETSKIDLYENYNCSQLEEQEDTIGEWYIAKFSYIATIPQSIGFDRGDQILIVDKSGDTGWWMAVIKGRTGFVPKEYIRKKE